MARFSNDSTHFRTFAASLEEAIFGYGETDEDHVTRQKRQVDTLTNLEKKFRETLIRDWRGPSVYVAFIKYVRDERRNILAARPFFRERQDIFKAQIAPALRDRKDKSLYRFNINYPFIAFTLKAKKFTPGSKIGKLAKQIEVARRELIEMNIPMAISRARAFANYRQQHLEYMDLVQIATEGLIAAIDKFVPPYGKVFGAVLYGRITGDLVEGNSETLIHFFPNYKRKLYTANKFVKEGWTFEQIAVKINEDAGAVVTDEHELQQLYTAAYTVSGDSPGEPSSSDPESGMGSSPIARFEADEDWRPDVRLEKKELMQALKKEIRSLSILEKKLLILKGVSL